MITETWLYSNILDTELFLPSFTTYRSERDPSHGKSKHGGVLIGVRSDLISEQIFLDGIPASMLVACIVTIGEHRFLIVCLNNPPNDSPYCMAQ